jgi:tRNA(Ile)-lysidine synthase
MPAMKLARPAPLREWIEPVGAAEFARLMDVFAPFEPEPHVAVAVSGGSDSMALAILAHDFARAKAGRVTALTVDHGLRPEAADEAAQTASWCAERGIAHEILRWSGPYPQSGIQEAARAARYRLLEDWCHAHGVLHLLVAHQREDQAETLLMRLLRGSGVEGLAGMAPVVERSAMRLLRPLLTLSRVRLQATLAAIDQSWIEDPSNSNPAYLRVKLRGQSDLLAKGGFSTERCTDLAARFGRVRVTLEAERARLLARSVILHPAGFAWLDPGPLLAAPEELGLAGLAAIITTISGADYPPRRERLERLLRLLPAGLAGGRTLGGCLILPRRGKLLVCREPAAAAPPRQARPGARTRWDGRFSVTLEAGMDDLMLGVLGAAAPVILNAVQPLVLAGIPAAARATLLTLRDANRVVAVPGLGYFSPRRPEATAATIRAIFRPTRPLAGAGFRIV